MRREQLVIDTFSDEKFEAIRVAGTLDGLLTNLERPGVIRPIHGAHLIGGPSGRAIFLVTASH